MRGVIYQYDLNGKLYIGKTYMEERKRMNKHKFEALTLMKEHPFCKAIRKYGWEFAKNNYSVVEEIFAEDKQSLNSKLIEREAFWIKTKNSQVPNGYNIYASGQETIPSWDLTDKERVYQKVSQSLKGKYMNCESTSREIYCHELDKWFPSMSEAERQLKIAKHSIQKAASGKNVQAGGYTWSFDGILPKRKNLIKEKCKALLCVDTGVIYSSVYQASKEILGDGKKKSAITAAIKRNGRCNGLKFEFIDMTIPCQAGKNRKV